MSKSENEVMDGRLNLRCPKAEEIRIREDASLANISISEMVRRRYFGRRVVADVDLTMIRELRRLGGLMKAIHISSNGAYSKETADALVQISNFIAELSRKK